MRPTIRRTTQLRSAIASLESQRALAPAMGTSRASASSPTNPAYIRLQTEIRAAEIDIESLEVELDELAAKRKEYEQFVMLAPDVERELLDLTRDYESHLRMYREIKDKQMKAALAASLEQELKGERLSLGRPAYLPDRPDKPNRPVIVILSLVLATTGGLGAVALSEILTIACMTKRVSPIF